MRAPVLALAALALIASCAPEPTNGLAGCFEDGRWRPGWASLTNGQCPTREEMITHAEMGARFDAAGRRDAFLPLPAPAKPVVLLKVPFGGRP